LENETMPTDEVLSGHRRFIERKFAGEKEVFRKLAEEGQNPKVLWIGCSDSRVIPEQITGAEAGELFTMRLIANVVPPKDAGSDASGAVIEYAVRHLGVPHIVICGHTDCGGIKALEADIDSAAEPHIWRWIEWARPARGRVEESSVPEGERLLETIKANVLLQLENLHSYDCVAEGMESGTLSTHAWLYDLADGNLLAYDEAGGAWRALSALP
jgi:carbonic anhydrase